MPYTFHMPESEKKSFSSLRKHAHQHKEALERTKGEEQHRTKEGLSPFPTYSNDMREYLLTFGEYFRDATDIPARIAEKKEHSENPIVVIDIAGAASGHTIGADKTISLIPQKIEGFVPHESQTIIEGDALSSKGMSDLTQAVNETGSLVSYAFFRPGAGFTGEEENEYSAARMFTGFKTVYDLLDEDGEFFIDLFFLPFADEFEKKLTEMNMSFEVARHEEISSKYGLFRVRKPSNKNVAANKGGLGANSLSQ